MTSHAAELGFRTSKPMESISGYQPRINYRFALADKSTDDFLVPAAAVLAVITAARSLPQFARALRIAPMEAVFERAAGGAAIE